MEHLFVYGTLAPGRPNEHILKVLQGLWRPATVRGRLRAAGWGAELGYPGIDLDENGEEIQGMLFSSPELVDVWPRLDAFEGEAYERRTVKVVLEDGTTEIASIYCLRAE